MSGVTSEGLLEVSADTLGEDLTDEIVQLYEEGVPIAHIVAQLRERGMAANWHLVHAVLDRCQVIRHSRTAEIPKGATEGISVSSLARIRNEVISTGRGEGARVVRRSDLPGLRRRIRASLQAYSTFGNSVTNRDQVRPARDDITLSKHRLAALAKRHAEGKGEPLRSLASRTGIDEAYLRHSLEGAGYTVRSYSEWTRLELERLAEEVVQQHVDKRMSPVEIVDWLGESHEVFISRAKLVRFLKSKNAYVRPVQQTSTQPTRKVPAGRIHRGSSRQGSTGMPTSDARWGLIHGREEELAHRILEGGEPVRDIATELGVDHNWLSATLKKTGHLPDVNLRRWRKQQRMSGKAT